MKYCGEYFDFSLSCLQPSSWARRLAASWAVNRHWYLSSTALNSCSLLLFTECIIGQARMQIRSELRAFYLCAIIIFSACVGRAKRHGLCNADRPSATQLVDDADDKLFESVLHNPEHTLYKLLPHRRHDITYTLRPRRHDLTLSRGSHCLTDCNFIVRQLFFTPYNFQLCSGCVLTAFLIK